LTGLSARHDLTTENRDRRRRRLLATGIACGVLSWAGAASAAVITYDVNLTFDPNATPESSLGAAGPGTVKGTITIDTSLPTGSPGDVTAVDLLEQSNNGTILSVFSNSATQLFDTVTPYDITFLGSQVTEYPAIYARYTAAQLYQFVSFSSGPIIDSIQEGPSIQFDFPDITGGAVLPGNFDSIATTGFNAYLFGTVTPVSVPEPSSWALLITGVGLLGSRLRGRSREGAAAADACA
jgi:hypothetical protein